MSLFLLAAVEKPATYGMEIQAASIPMPDGVRLAADLYRPTGGKAGERFPVLLEYLPYRKTESRSRNYRLYSYFVRARLRGRAVDIRGTGNSEGRLIPYEYSDIEQRGRRGRHRLALEAAPGRTATSGCSASPGAASTPSRWRCATRPR